VAANVAALGAACTVVGCVGADDAGRRLRAGLDALGAGTVRTLLVEDGGRPTTTKTRVVARHQQVVRYDRERDDEVAGDVAARLCGLVEEAVAGADALVLEDYNKGVLAPAVIRAALAAARGAGIPMVVDPKFRNFFAFAGRHGVQAQRGRAERRARGSRSPAGTTAGWRRRARGWGRGTCCSRWARTGWRCAPRAAGRSACLPSPARCSTSRARGTR
jgi:rfaE bifunctional protein kinase chain/domain